jgi:hypothetical protein
MMSHYVISPFHEAKKALGKSPYFSSSNNIPGVSVEGGTQSLKDAGAIASLPLLQEQFINLGKSFRRVVWLFGRGLACLHLA